MRLSNAWDMMDKDEPEITVSLRQSQSMMALGALSGLYFDYLKQGANKEAEGIKATIQKFYEKSLPDLSLTVDQYLLFTAAKMKNKP